MRTPMLVLALAISTAAGASEPTTWTFELETSGEDVFATSPTSVDAAAPRFHGAYELTGFWVTVEFFGQPIEVEVTNQIPPEFLTGSGLEPGPAPIVIFDQQIVAPPDPPTAVEADLLVGLNENGFGFVEATNIVLGVADVGFGVLPIIAIRMAADVTVIANPSDLTCDGAVDVDDLLLILSSWGGAGGDVNFDGTTDVGDLLQLLADWS